jgi:hypothetical protein
MSINKCPVYRVDSIDNAWLDIRAVFGPANAQIGSDTYIRNTSEWTAWAVSNGVDPLNVDKFGKWLIWLLTYGTVNYGNLPSDKKHEHTGRCWSPCPFDSTCYDAIRSETMLGYVPTSLSNHSSSYMKPAYHGTWGMECTYSGCPYLIEYGRPYFYV